MDNITTPKQQSSQARCLEPIQRHQEYYDRRWRKEPFANALQAARCSAILKALSETELEEPKILDLGCGTGWMSLILSRFGPTTAIDLSDYAIEEASRKYPEVNFLQADILHLNASAVSGEFDVVVSQEVIEHMNDQDGYLRIAHKLLREGGYLILTTPNAQTLAAMREDVRHAWSDQPFEQILTVREVKKLVEQYLKIVEVTTIIRCGTRGLHRIVNSPKLGRVLGAFGMRRIFETACLESGFGLHTLVVAVKQSGASRST